MLSSRYKLDILEKAKGLIALSVVFILVGIFTMIIPVAMADTAGEKIWDVDLSKYESIANGKYATIEIIDGKVKIELKSI